MEKFREIINYLFSSKNVFSMGILFVALVGGFYAAQTYVMPLWNGPDGVMTAKDDITTSKTTLEGLREQKKAKEIAAKKNKIKIDKVPVQIFRSQKEGLSVESSSIDFVTKIISMLDKTDNKIMDISYKIDPLSEADKISMPSTVSVVQLVMTLNSSYTDFNNFVNMLYDYDYLATIKTIKVTPLKENKNILEINVVLWLYVSR